MSDKIRITIAASECFPFSKTGGLADVVGALPKELEKIGCEVCVFTPLYQCVKNGKFDLQDLGKEITIVISDRLVKGTIYKSTIGNNVAVYFIGNDHYYNRPELYSTNDGDYLDNAERFIFFSKAVIEALKELNIQTDVMHCNDWQTGLIPVFFKLKENNNTFFSQTSTVFTIHNLAYQGLFWHLDMPLTNLSWDIFSPEGIEFYGKINLMKAGIVFADLINTVSKTYSKEIQTEELGCGLEGILKTRADKLFGILNGVDYDVWDPETDPFIKQNYSCIDMSGKTLCKQDLLDSFELTNNNNLPIFGMISRLEDQKGFDLITKRFEDFMALDLILVILGTGNNKYQKIFEELKQQYPDRLGVKITFDNSLAHKIEAGSDFFLMPSRFEPCGLNQMYSLRYGTVPIVRATGGLNDTVKDFNPQTEIGNGFSFKPYTSNALLEKIKQALKIYKSKNHFNRLRCNGMQEDFSWMAAAKQYLKLYKKSLSK
ncbi:MAG: glycogen synthase GlgA [Candidatus Auribacterota bacterium]